MSTRGTTNGRIAALLREFADLLELSGESAFRSQAFRRAADTIAQYPAPLSSLGAGALLKIPGIGKGIAATVNEIGRTGTFQDLEQLRQVIPSSVMTFTALPGVGIKTAVKLHRLLGVTTLAELRATTIGGKVTATPGLGKKLAEQLVTGFAQLDRYQNRWSIGIAYPFAATMAEQLAGRTGARVEVAGEARRLAETVGDITLLAAGVDPAAIFAAFDALPAVVTPLGHEQGFAAVELDRGLVARVVVTTAARFGTEWVRHTGNDLHVGALRALGGPDVFDRAFETEEAFYRELGLPFIPADMRLGRDELELARSGALSTVITDAGIRGDLHAHTDWSDGRNTIEEMALAALELGYSYLTISDHSPSLGVANGLSAERLRAQWLEIDRLNAELRPFRIFKSCEVEIKRNGELDLPDEVLAGLDLVIASLHSGLRDPSDVVTGRLAAAIRHPHVDIIAHPSGRLIGGRDGADYDWEAVYRAAAGSRTALEINASSERLDLTDERAREALAHGVTISLGSDAHSVEGLAAMRFGVAAARRAGLTAGSLLNARTADQFTHR